MLRKRQATKMKVGHNHRLRVGQDCLGMVKREKNVASRDKCVRSKRQERCFVTSAMLSLQHSVGHRTKIADIVCKVKAGKERGEDIGTARFIDFHSHRRYTVQVCGDSKVVEKWINGTCVMGPKDREQMDSIQRTLHSLWRRKVACPV